MLESLSLKEKVVMVTGATKGLGNGMARGLADAGASLIIVSRNQDDCEKVAAELSEQGRVALPVAADMRDLGSIDDLVQQVVEQFGKIDVLINNAGTALTKTPEDLTEEDWDQVVDLNLKGAFFAAQRVGKQMIRQKQGKIVNIASIFGLVGDGNILPYSASKGGLVLMTRSLALAWSRHNIKVNALAPGYIETEMNSSVLNQEKVHRHLMRNTPLKRLGKVEDLKGAVVFLSSPASDYMTGEVMVVDGGWAAH